MDVGLERDAFLYVSDVEEAATARTAGTRRPRRSRRQAAERPDDTYGSPGRRQRSIDELLGPGPGADRAGGQGPAAEQGRPHHHPRHAARAATWCCCRRSATSASPGASRRRRSATGWCDLVEEMSRRRPPRPDRAHGRRRQGARGLRGRPRLARQALGARSSAGPTRAPPRPPPPGAGPGPARGAGPLLPRRVGRSGSTTRRPTSASSSSSTRSSRRLLGRVKLYGQETPLFDRFGIEGQIEAALRSKVWLKSRRLHRDQPHRGAGRHRRQHRPLRRQDQPRADGARDQPRGGRGDRPPDPAARPGRHPRPRPDRHDRGGAPRSGCSPPWSASWRRTARRPRCWRSPSSGWSRSPASARAPTSSGCSPSRAPTARGAAGSARSRRSA